MLTDFLSHYGERPRSHYRGAFRSHCGTEAPRCCARPASGLVTGLLAVAQRRFLVADLRSRGDEVAVRHAVDRLRPEGRDSVAVLERQPHPEVALQRTPDGVTGQRSEQLSTHLLVRRTPSASSRVR